MFFLLFINLCFSICNSIKIGENNVVYPNTTIELDNNFDYNIEYYNNSLWFNSGINLTNKNNISYYNFLDYKKFKLRLKFNKTNYSNNFSNNFSLAYIDADYHINNKIIHINWKNINFKSNNSLFLDYYFNNKFNKPLFTEIKIKNTHIINITKFIQKYLIFGFILIVRSNDYKIETIIPINYDKLIEIYTNNTHSRTSLCIYKFCNHDVKKKSQTCINNKIYKSVCHAVCHNEKFN